MKKGLLVLLTVFTTLLMGACNSKEEGLVVLTSSGYEPYQMVDAQGNLVGFDIDLMEAIAAYLDLKIVWKDVDFDGIIASLQLNQADAAIAGITPTEQRSMIVDFSTIYYNSESGLQNMMLFDESNEINTLDDLNGLTVGAQMGTIQAELLMTLSETYNFTLDLRNNNAQIIEEIKAGRIDVLVVEKLVADSIKTNNGFLMSTELDYDLGNLYGNAIAFPKNSQLVEQFNEAILALIENGTMQNLIEKWFNK